MNTQASCKKRKNYTILSLTFMILKCFDKGITPVSILGTLVKAIVAFDIKGISGAVKSLNLIFPERAVSSALTSIGVFNAV
jgi:hypothetical protein